PLDALLPLRARGQDPGFFRKSQAQGKGPLRAEVMRKDGAELDVELSLGTRGELLVVSLRRAHDDARVPPDERYRLVFENAPVGVLHYDARGVTTDCNGAMVQLLGSSKDLVIGINMTTLQGDPTRERIATLIRGTLAGRAARYEGPYKSLTSQKIAECVALFAPILGPGGAVLGGIGIVEDVTERKRIEARLSRADRMASIGTLAAGVAHEINNPLVYVTLGLELIDRELSRLRLRPAVPAADEWERMRNWVREALEGAERVRAIVRDLRTFSRPGEQQAVPVDVEKVLESSINMALSHIRPRAQLVRDYHKVPAVLADESRLGQVFLNLLVNAAQAIPEGAADLNAITVRTRSGLSGEAIVEVRDSGIGIEPWKIERIFEPFWTDKPVGVGTGLGLSIVHGIVSALGGEITVQSTPGRGSIFRVILPGAPPGELRAAPVVVSAPRTPGRRLRLLLIDDEPYLGVTLKTGLRDEAEVVAAREGREALRILHEDQEFDLILCDLMMPGLTGMDVFDQVSRELPALCRRFVFMTGGAVTERARRFLDGMPDQRLDKPFRLEQVEALLRRIPR
ncbi:MAG TPA: ATP-binding protein, partial [Myxococcales bacterium]|nr:ATP-binding protein [Myxococcales bacterium]